MQYLPTERPYLDHMSDIIKEKWPYSDHMSTTYVTTLKESQN